VIESFHEGPTLEQMAQCDKNRSPQAFPYRVFVRRTGKLICFRDYVNASRRTNAARGDVLYRHDGQRWRIWTSGSLF
jgi:hypothetical protein